MSLNTDDIEDIKQLVAANSQVVLAEVADMLAGQTKELTQKIDVVEKKVDDLTEFVTDAIDTSNDETGKQLTNHETRISRLEKRAA